MAFGIDGVQSMSYNRTKLTSGATRGGAGHTGGEVINRGQFVSSTQPYNRGNSKVNTRVTVVALKVTAEKKPVQRAQTLPSTQSNERAAFFKRYDGVRAQQLSKPQDISKAQTMENEEPRDHLNSNPFSVTALTLTQPSPSQAIAIPEPQKKEGEESSNGSSPELYSVTDPTITKARNFMDRVINRAGQTPEVSFGSSDSGSSVDEKDKDYYC